MISTSLPHPPGWHFTRQWHLLLPVSAPTSFDKGWEVVCWDIIWPVTLLDFLVQLETPCLSCESLLSGAGGFSLTRLSTICGALAMSNSKNTALLAIGKAIWLWAQLLHAPRMGPVPTALCRGLRSTRHAGLSFFFLPHCFPHANWRLFTGKDLSCCCSILSTSLVAGINHIPLGQACVCTDQ